MSGPVLPRDDACENEPRRDADVIEGRRATVGGAAIARVLPTKGRRTVGPWCFVDLITPGDAEEPDPMEVGPHPHIGLLTVTWLVDGEAVHGDSLGTQQAIRPGQLNLMTAGHGIAHAELELGRGLRGAQLWLAQPAATRHGPGRFEHHAALPQTGLAHGSATVLLGRLADVSSPVTADWPALAAELDLRQGSVTLTVDRDHEHAVVPLDHPVRLGDTGDDPIVEPGWLAYLPAGRDAIDVAARRAGKVLLLGGAPFEARPLMWWNFVARERDELTAAYLDWRDRNSDRFGDVPSDLERIEAPRPPWLGQA